MAFDLFSGTIATVCLIVLIITSLSLYYNQTSNKQLMKAQLYDVIDQINSAHEHHFNLTRQIQEQQNQMRKDINKLASSVRFLENQMQKSEILSIFSPKAMAAATPVPFTSVQPARVVTTARPTTPRPVVTTARPTTPRPVVTTPRPTTPRPTTPRPITTTPSRLTTTPRPPVVGRHVRIFFSDGTMKTLHINEIEVYGTSGTIISRGKACTSSSVLNNNFAQFGPANLVDGNTRSVTNNVLKLAHTNTQVNPFVAVDLGSDMPIQRIVVYNRDDCCGDRIVGARIRVTNTANVTVFEQAITTNQATYTYNL